MKNYIQGYLKGLIIGVMLEYIIRVDNKGIGAYAVIGMVLVLTIFELFDINKPKL
jgi:hypothetical protein